MRIKRFAAKDLPAVVGLIKEEFGLAAVILSQRENPETGEVEVTAGVREEDIAPVPPASAPTELPPGAVAGSGPGPQPRNGSGQQTQGVSGPQARGGQVGQVPGGSGQLAHGASGPQAPSGFGSQVPGASGPQAPGASGPGRPAAGPGAVAGAYRSSEGQGGAFPSGGQGAGQSGGGRGAGRLAEGGAGAEISGGVQDIGRSQGRGADDGIGRGHGGGTGFAEVLEGESPIPLTDVVSPPPSGYSARPVAVAASIEPARPPDRVGGPPLSATGRGPADVAPAGPALGATGSGAALSGQTARPSASGKPGAGRAAAASAGKAPSGGPGGKRSGAADAAGRASGAAAPSSKAAAPPSALPSGGRSRPGAPGPGGDFAVLESALPGGSQTLPARDLKPAGMRPRAGSAAGAMLYRDSEARGLGAFSVEKGISDMRAELGDRLGELKEMLLDLAHRQSLAEKWRDRGDLVALYRRLLDTGLAPPYAREFVEAAAESLSAWGGELGDQLRKTVRPFVRTVPPDRAGTRILAFVGPTGGGKTASLMKTAAFLKQKGRKCAIISLDTLKLGAAEELLQFARIMGLGLKICQSRAEFSEARELFEGADRILVDTSTRDFFPPSGKDLPGALAESGAANLLVLPATHKSQDLAASWRVAAGPFLMGAVLTKLDETVSLGGVINFARSVGPVFAYFSKGYKSPGDFMAADADALMDLWLSAPPDPGQGYGPPG